MASTIPTSEVSLNTHSLQDTSKFASGGIWAPTSANFPCCKHFWSCPQTDVGNTRLTDLMGAAHLVKPSGTVAAGGDGNSVFPNQTATSTTVSGTLTPVGSGYLLVMAVANWGAAAGMAIGNVVAGEGVSLGATNFIIDLAATQAFGQPFTLVSSIAGRATLIRTWNGIAGATTGQAQFEASATSTINVPGNEATTSIEAFTTWGATNKWACTSGATSSLYGAAVFLFTTLPSDGFVKSLVAWHTYQWKNGNKWIHPALLGVS